MGAQNNFCTYVLIAFGALWLIAMALLAIGTFGLFGVEGDPLAGVFIIPLGLPWNRLVDFGGAAQVWWVVFSPLLNLALLALICRVVSALRRK